MIFRGVFFVLASPSVGVANRWPSRTGLERAVLAAAVDLALGHDLGDVLDVEGRA
jgi:hypothetical protein